LAALGARAPAEEREDCGFVYYGRHFRSPDGSVPPALGPGLQAYDSVSTLTLPADNGTWGVGLVTSSRDPALRAARDVDVWSRVIRAYPLVAHWLDGEAISGVDVMAKIEDRHRAYVVDGAPVATGVVSIADAWACTNPSVGRGASIGLLHATILRDVLREHALDDHLGFAEAFDAATRGSVELYYRDTLSFDRHRLAEIEAQIAGVPYEPDDPEWRLGHALEAAAAVDHVCLRAMLDVISVLERGADVLARPGMAERVAEHGATGDGAQRPGPARAELLAIVAG
jgi:hypothetical protein